MPSDQVVQAILRERGPCGKQAGLPSRALDFCAEVQYCQRFWFCVCVAASKCKLLNKTLVIFPWKLLWLIATWTFPPPCPSKACQAVSIKPAPRL